MKRRQCKKNEFLVNLLYNEIYCVDERSKSKRI